MNVLSLDPEDWTEDTTGAFIQDVTCANSSSQVYGNVDVNIDESLGEFVTLPYNRTEIKNILKAWSCIDKCELFDGYVRFYCYFKTPTRDISVNLQIFN